MPKSFGQYLEVARIQSEMNKLFDNLLDLGTTEDEGGAWSPNVDILDTTDYLVVKAEMPGVARDDLRVTVNSGNLILKGSKREPKEKRDGEVHLAERSFGTFRRSISLGIPVNTRKAEAVFSDGLLKITFPKVPNRRGEEVPIEVKGI